MAERKAETRDRFPHFYELQTRWADNDIYGHVNNAAYYYYFDSVVNRYMIEHGGFEFLTAPVVGIVAETMCRFRKSFAFPETVEAGLRVGHLGTTSVRHEIGIFRRGDDEAAAHGHFVHVFVDRTTMRPVPIPVAVRAALERLRVRG